MRTSNHVRHGIPPFLFLILVGVLAAGCAGTPPARAPESNFPVTTPPGMEISAAPDSVRDLPGFSGRIYTDGNIFIGGQPKPEALTALPERGITAVINLRTAKEMGDTSKVAFDESALVDSLGLEYVEIPMGGKDHPYEPAAVEAFATALDRNDGHVLLHCASGGRASHLWAAYLVRYHGWEVTEAYRRGQAIGISRSPFSKFLDLKTKVVVDDS